VQRANITKELHAQKFRLLYAIAGTHDFLEATTCNCVLNLLWDNHVIATRTTKQGEAELLATKVYSGQVREGKATKPVLQPL
jgi:hypothetical protein